MDDITANPLFQFAPVAYSVLNLELEQVAANERFYSLFGYGRNAVISASDLTHPDDQEITKVYIDGVIAGQSMGSLEKRYIRADGSMFWGRLTARPLDLDGTDVLVGVIENVQTQHDLLDDLNESVRKADEQATLRARFVSQVSHELRNPLHLIAGTSELLSEAPIPMKHRQQAASVLREATSLALLVDDLLDISRSDGGKLALQPSTFSSRSLIDRIRQTMAEQASEKGLRLTVEVDEAVPVYLEGDAGRLRQILVNLTSNAVKFTDTGTVRLLVDAIDQRTLRFRVIDSGPGIPEEGLATIFDPFVRFSRSASGAGLGLAISSRLASLLGGTLTVANIEPTGAMFELIAPLPEATGPITVGTLINNPEPLGAETGKHILIVEDSQENQLLASAQLDALGYTSDIAPDGFEALSLLQDEEYDAILMDWHLPGMDGLETTRRIRADEEQNHVRRIPVIALTARAMADDIDACFDAGADDHIAKPASLDTLRRVLTRWTADLPNEIDAPVSDSDGVDREALITLFDNLGDVDLVSSIVTTYLDELDGRISRIVEAESAEAVESAAHVLASTSAIVGASALGGLARQIEDAVRGGSDTDPDLIDRLVESAHDTSSSILNEFNRLKVGT